MQISVNVFMTLDGVMQSPGAPEEDPGNGFTQGGWLVPFPSSTWGHVVDGWFQRTSAILLGRSTFEMMQFPVLVGGGKSVFGDHCTPTGFDVTAAEMLDGGVAAYELKVSRLGSTAAGAYRVEQGKEVVA